MLQRVHEVELLQDWQPLMQATHSPLAFTNLPEGHEHTPLARTKLGLQVTQLLAAVQVAQAAGQAVQNLMGVTAKKNPARQVQEPSLLLVAPTTH